MLDGRFGRSRADAGRYLRQGQLIPTTRSAFAWKVRCFSACESPKGRTMFTRPTAKHLLCIHQRLIAGDPVAPAELAAVAIAPLAAILRINNRLRDESMAHDAATDSVLEFAKSPESHKP